MATYNNIISRTDSQALVPEVVSDAILSNLQAQSAAMTLFKHIPMATSQTRMPVLSALPTAYFLNGDTGLKQTTEVDWSNKYLNVEELACIVPIPENVLDDTGFDVWGAVKPLLEQAIGRALDAAVFFGTNKPASWPSDIATAATAAGNTVNRGTNANTAGGIVGDFSDLWGTLEADGYDPNSLVATTTLKGRLRQARASTGESLLGFGEATQAAVFGVDAMYPMRGLWPTGSGAVEAFAFDRMNFILGLRKDITYKLLDQAVIQDGSGAIVYNLAQQDMVALRVTFRCAYQVANTINYDQQTEASRYPAAVLKAP